jgi:hypothetical protein
MFRSQAVESVPVNSVNSSRILNIGSGHSRVADAINVDVTSRTSPDVVHDLNLLTLAFSG